MEKNKFNITPSTDETIDTSSMESGAGVIHCNYERVYSDIINSSENYDNTFNTPIMKSDIVYLGGFPSKIISYEEMIEIGVNKYYWDSLNQKLYKFNLGENVSPFVKNGQKIIGCNGVPSEGAVDVDKEFSKDDEYGSFTEVVIGTPISSYIIIHGYPEGYAPKPYREDIYYYDDVNKKYYKYTSNYTKNINNWYYDKTVKSAEMLKYSYESKSWTRVNETFNISGDPNNLITITSEESDPDSLIFNINDINKVICYCNILTDTLYYFDYGRYLVEISYTGTIYERPLEFYRKMNDVFLKVNSVDAINTKNIYYFYGNFNDIKEIDNTRVYYDARNNRYYKYRNNSWEEIAQENLMVPQTMFPYTHHKL